MSMKVRNFPLLTSSLPIVVVVERLSVVGPLLRGIGTQGQVFVFVFVCGRKWSSCKSPFVYIYVHK